MAENKQQPDTIYSLSSKPGNYFPFAKKMWLMGGGLAIWTHTVQKCGQLAEG